MAELQLAAFNRKFVIFKFCYCIRNYLLVPTFRLMLAKSDFDWVGVGV